MALDAGVRLGPYEIVAPIGAGGMGEVYRARDTRLDRTVAIKVLPASLAADPQLRERFDREARAISALNHPHICTLHDVGHQDGVDFLVLEYLDGETLADRMAAGGPERPSVPVHDALTIAIQVADALDKAHRSGIVHRDLKPANIFLVRRGASAPVSAKLLDFGLAKTAAPVIAASGLSMAPTTPPNLTAQGTILGTFQYMAPEQIEGLEADARSDIFALGAVLFEMLTGRPAFEGKTRAQLLGAILKDEPPPVSQSLALILSKGESDARGSTGSPRAELLDRIVATCLAKDPDDRWQTARDLLRELQWVADAGPAEAGPHVLHSANRTWGPPLGGPTAWAIAGVLVVALIASGTIALRHLRETPPAAQTYQFTIPAPENTQFGGPPGGGTGAATQLAISPDGRHVAFVGRRDSTYSLWIRPTATLAARPLPGTEGAAFPFWSPDGRYIGFFAAGKMKKVEAAGGPAIILCDAPGGRGGTWSRDNVILFSPFTTGGLQRVSAAGGVPVPVSALDTAYGESSHRWPHFLRDGRHFVFTGSVGTCCPASKPARLRIGSLDTKDAATLLEVESSSAVASGHLFFVRDGTLMAQPLDQNALRLTADAFPVAETIAGEGSRYGSFSVSESGTLVYARGAASTSGRLVWFDRTGKTLGTVGDAGAYLTIALSPDERRVAASMQTGLPFNRDVWLIDIVRGVGSRLTFDATDEGTPVWSPDGTRVAFWKAGTKAGLHIKSASGIGAEELLFSAGLSTPLFLEDWSADGRFIVYAAPPNGTAAMDLWIIPMSGDRKPIALAQDPGVQARAAFAPDSRWIAYTSDESGSAQIYVQPFPVAGGRFQISRDGGAQPQWRGDGKELFFVTPDGTVMSATIDTTHDFQAGIPQILFQASPASAAGRRQYAVARDGKRFLMINTDRAAIGSPLTVVVNWLAAVQK